MKVQMIYAHTSPLHYHLIAAVAADDAVLRKLTAAFDAIALESGDLIVKHHPIDGFTSDAEQALIDAIELAVQENRQAMSEADQDLSDCDD